MIKRIKSQRRKLLFLAALVIIMLFVAYHVAKIPKVDSNLPQPSELPCSSGVDCPENETCRRDISLVTKNFIGEYKCRTLVWDQGACETWNNCESGVCAEGKCEKEK